MMRHAASLPTPPSGGGGGDARDAGREPHAVRDAVGIIAAAVFATVARYCCCAVVPSVVVSLLCACM